MTKVKSTGTAVYQLQIKMPPVLYRIDDVCSVLETTTDTVRHLMDSGNLRFVYLEENERMLRITHESLVGFLSAAMRRLVATLTTEELEKNFDTLKGMCIIEQLTQPVPKRWVIHSFEDSDPGDH